MNLFKKARSRSPSFDIPKLCLSRQKRTEVAPPDMAAPGTDTAAYPDTPSAATGTDGGTWNDDPSGSAMTGTGSGGGLSPSPSSTSFPVDGGGVVPGTPPPTPVDDGEGRRKKRGKKKVTSGSSLEVPHLPRIRSSSFDTSTLHHDDPASGDNTLTVPEASFRSRSFDASYSSEEYVSDKETFSSSIFLALPKYYRRRSLEIPRLCIHCVHLEALSSQENTPTSPGGNKFENLSEHPSRPKCPSSSSFAYDSLDDDFSSDDDSDDDLDDDLDSGGRSHAPCVRVSLTPPATGSSDLSREPSEEEGCSVVTLTVPMWKPRSSSMDAAYLSVNTTYDERRGSFDPACMLDVPKQPRSSSVDVTLPTPETGRYKAITTTKAEDR